MSADNKSDNSMTEENTKNILAYFKNLEEANTVLDRLGNLGVADVQIERFNKYSMGSSDQFMNPLNDDTNSQAALTLGVNAGRDTGILVSTDVSASGMSDGGQNPISGRDIILGAVVKEALFDKARELIREGNGLV